MTDYSPLELSLPERTGQETVEQRLTALEETVPRLLEALQYTLSNLGAENFNAAALSRLLSPIRARIDGADGSITQLSLDAGTLQTRLTSALRRSRRAGHRRRHPRENRRCRNVQDRADGRGGAQHPGRRSDRPR